MPRALSPFAAALADLRDTFAALRVDWYVFGAQAALVYGAARVTADVDVTVRLGKVTPARLATALKRHGFRLRLDDPAFVRTTRVLPIQHVLTSVPADLVLAGPGLEDSFLERAAVRDLGGVRVPVARAEDLIVMKILAGRDKDLDDVAAILSARRGKLDTKEIRSTLAMVEKALGQSDLVPAWAREEAPLRTPRGDRRPTSPSRCPMSALLVPFLYELRKRQLEVGTEELVALAKGMALGLHIGRRAPRPPRLPIGGDAASSGRERALGMADARRYRRYRSDLVLDVRQIELALRRLRSFSRDGREDELELFEPVNPRYKLVIVGDAAMAPGEMLSVGPWGSTWRRPDGTLDGLAEAVSYLSKDGAAKLPPFTGMPRRSGAGPARVPRACADPAPSCGACGR